MLKADRFSCSQKIWLKWDPPVLGQCKYPKWAVKKISQQHQVQKKKQTPTKKYSTKKCNIVIPYTQGICESIKNM